MAPGFSSVTEQVAQAIRDGIIQGQWNKTIPGRNSLAAELGVNHKTVKAALDILDKEGLVESQGPGRERRIVSREASTPLALRVVVLVYEDADLKSVDMMEIIHRLRTAGHMVNFAVKTLIGLGMELGRVIDFVERTEADAWVVVSASGDILRWFAGQPTPAFALYGRIHQVSIPSHGTKKGDALVELVDALFKLGHRRIVLLSREDRRKPDLGAFERRFLEHLQHLGIRTGKYNLPDWGDGPDDLQQNLAAIFRHTPPTALIVDDSMTFLAVVQQLAKLGIVAPDQISLACTDFTPAFEWCRPKIAHIRLNPATAINRVVKWTNQISRGKKDLRHTMTKGKLVIGGTIGPIPTQLR